MRYLNGICHVGRWVLLFFVRSLLDLFIYTSLLCLLFEQVSFANVPSFGQGRVQDPSVHVPASQSLAREMNTKNKPAGANVKPLLHDNPFSKVPVFADGQTALPSNSSDFRGKWHASVNPRTGMPAFSFALSSIMHRSGEYVRDLVLSYSGSSVPSGPNPFSLGSQWQWNIGYEHSSNREIAGHHTVEVSAGNGHVFTMISDRNAKGGVYWHPLRYRLKDVKIKGEPGNWTFLFASGLRVHIQNGYEDWEDFPDGARIWFYYDRNNPGDVSRRLRYVCPHKIGVSRLKKYDNACREGIQLVSHGNRVDIHGRQKLTLYKSGNSAGISQLVRIDFPALSSEEKATGHHRIDSMNFAYDAQGNRPWLIQRIRYPGGAGVTFLYNNESSRAGALSSGLPVGINHAFLPVVTEEIIHSGTRAIPDKHIWFRYGSEGRNNHNYTGYQGSRIMIPGRDNLLDRADNYTYQVTMDDGLTQTTTIYNKYHLPLQVIVRDDNSNSVIAMDQKGYAPWKNTTFDQLSPTYFFPLRMTKVLFSLREKGKEDLSDPVKLTQQMQYDKQGRLIWQKSATGQETFIQYCPVTGDSHCPAKLDDYPDMSLPEKIVKLPARDDAKGHAREVSVNPGDDPAPVTEQVFDYLYLFPVIKKRAHHSSQRVMEANVNNSLWKVRTKTIGALPLTAMNGIRPGAQLPELVPEDTVAKSQYEYDVHPDSISFGKLVHLRITKPRPLQKMMRGLPEAGVPTQQQSADFYMHYEVDIKSGKRFTSVSSFADPMPAAGDVYKKNIRFSESHAVFLGRSTFSLGSGLTLETRDSLGEKRVSWVYDQWDRPVKRITTLLHGGEPHVTSWHYFVSRNESGVVMTDYSGNQQKTVVGPDGEIISVWHRFSGQAQGDSGWIPDRELTYTRTGKPKTLTVWRADDRDGMSGKPGKAIPLVIRWGYDALNRQVWKKGPDGQMIFTLMDDARLRSMSYRAATSKNGDSKLLLLLHVVESDKSGHPVAFYRFSLNPEEKKDGNYLYSLPMRTHLEHLLSTRHSVNSLEVLHGNGLLFMGGKEGLAVFVQKAISQGVWLARTLMKYDGNGRLVEKNQGRGKITRWFWEKGRMSGTLLPDGRLVKSMTNIQGKDTMRCLRPVGGAVCHLLGMREYDSTGNVLWQADGAGNLIRYMRDADGRLLSVHLPPADNNDPGHVISWEYNSMGPIAKRLDGKLLEWYEYDPVSWRLTDREDKISHLHYSYDRAGRLIKMTRQAPVKLRSPENIHYPEGSTTVSYDRYSQPLWFSDLAGYRHTVVHDALGRTLFRYVYLPGHVKRTLLASTVYDEFSRPVKITNGVGITRSFEYDEAGQIASVSDYQGVGLIQKLTYFWEPQTGNLKRLIRQEKGMAAVQNYRYDPENNLTAMTCHATDHIRWPSLCPRDTEISNSTLSKPPAILSQNYTFDGWNNIHTVKEKVMKNDGSVTTKTVTYHHAGDRAENKPEWFDPFRITSMRTVWAGVRYSTIPQTIVWDKLGRMVRDGNGNRLYYNALGKQSAFFDAHTKVFTRYTYDGNGNQVAVQLFTSQNREIQKPLYMIYQGNHVAIQVQEGSDHHNNVTEELGGIAHSENGHIVYWYLHDYKGDVITLADATGHVVADHVYSPYGMNYERLHQNLRVFDQRFSAAKDAPLWQRHLPGFDGEMTDPSTNYQFLGGGYRAYSSVYRHFMSVDSFSPFIQMDGYGFANNNPVMNTDPSGHLSNVVNYVAGAFTIALSAMLLVLTPVMAVEAMVAASVANSTSFAILGLSISGGVATLGTGIVSGSLQVARASNPTNRRLSIASGVFSILGGASILAMGAGTALAGTMFYYYSFEAVRQFFPILSGGGAGLAGIVSMINSSLAIAAGAQRGVGLRYENAIIALNYAGAICMLISMISMAPILVFKAVKSLWSSAADQLSKEIPLEDMPAQQEMPVVQEVPPERYQASAKSSSPEEELPPQQELPPEEVQIEGIYSRLQHHKSPSPPDSPPPPIPPRTYLSQTPGNEVFIPNGNEILDEDEEPHYDVAEFDRPPAPLPERVISAVEIYDSHSSFGSSLDDLAVNPDYFGSPPSPSHQSELRIPSEYDYITTRSARDL